MNIKALLASSSGKDAFTTAFKNFLLDASCDVDARAVQRMSDTCVTALTELIRSNEERQSQAERSTDQMHLGELINLLETLDGNRQVLGFGSLHSYRVYYSDLAFEPADEIRSVAALLRECRHAVAPYMTFTGYKGGSFEMDEHTPLWIASYGNASNTKLIGLDTSRDIIQPIMKKQE